MPFDISNYIDVAQRLAEFRARHPEGSLQPLDLTHPFTVLELGERVFIVYVAAAYRTSDDPKPGIGAAWEPFPGKTSYTKDSELQNAETSAWGRAIVAALAADTRKGIATAEEVRNRQAEEEPPKTQAVHTISRSSAPRKRPPPNVQAAAAVVIAAPENREQVARIRARLGGLDEEGLAWARDIAKEEGIPKFDSTEVKPGQLDKLEEILTLAEAGRPFNEESF